MKKLLMLFILSFSSLFALELYIGAGTYNGTSYDKTAYPNSVSTNIGDHAGIDFRAGLRFESGNQLEIIYDSVEVGTSGANGIKYDGSLLNYIWNLDSLSILGTTPFLSFGAGQYTIRNTILSYTALRSSFGFNIPIMGLELELSGERTNILLGSDSRMLTSSYIGIRYFF